MIPIPGNPPNYVKTPHYWNPGIGRYPKGVCYYYVRERYLLEFVNAWRRESFLDDDDEDDDDDDDDDDEDDEKHENEEDDDVRPRSVGHPFW